MEPRTQRGHEGVDVLSRRDAPEQNDPAMERNSGGEPVEIPIQRAAVPLIAGVHVHGRELAEAPGRYARIRRLQPAGRRDDENRAGGAGRSGWSGR